MRQVIIILTTIFLTSCSCKYDDKDFQFAETHNKLLKPYSIDDTIYFANQSGDLDTLTISNIDTLQQCGCIMVGNRRAISIEIKHLPVNKWTGGREFYQGKPPKVLDQELIVIQKMPDDKDGNYFIGINYRNFMGELTAIDSFSTDNKFIDLDISKYWTIKNQSTDWQQYKQDSTLIINAYWTENYGLTSYELRNGDTYRIMKNVP